MKTTTEDMISLVDLETGFRTGARKRFRVSGPLNATLVPGELVAVIGKNGSGKSTLLRTLAGLQKPLRGRLLHGGSPMNAKSPKDLARLISYVSTEVVRVQGMLVRQLVSMGRYPHTGWFGSLGDEDRNLVLNALRLTSLTSLAERDMDEISDGERQRAMIARMLAQDTPVLLLDEPSAFLDLTHRIEIIQLLKTLSRERERCILFSTHDIQAALREADRIWLMHGPGIVEGAPEDLALSGTLDDVLLDPGSNADIRFDMERGEFLIRKEPGEAVQVHSNDKTLKTWTIRAVERMGYNPASNQSGPVNVIAENRAGRHAWVLEKNGKKIEFNSIYDLSLYLRSDI
jgi:iron complex transport system ATP-binding protein